MTLTAILMVWPIRLASPSPHAAVGPRLPIPPKSLAKSRHVDRFAFALDNRVTIDANHTDILDRRAPALACSFNGLIVNAPPRR
jgi:hypothetical protein